MSEKIRIKKGLDIPLAGKVEDYAEITVRDTLTGIVPDDFPGYKWKAAVKEGDKVLKGEPLMYAAENDALKLTSPVSGIVREIRRGERRKILAVTVAREITDAEEEKRFAGNDILQILCESGLFAMIRQRPYDIVPDPAVRPRDIFITAFDTAPLAGPVIFPSESEWLGKGIKALRQLTDGKVYLNVKFGSGISDPNAVVTEFQGPHPAGNAGVQAAAIKPVNKGETVWTLDARTAVRIGKLADTGRLDTGCKVFVTGPLVAHPYLAKCVEGTAMKDLVDGKLNASEDECRIISGNALTGTKTDPETGFLRFPYRQVTVIREGNHTDEFMGWASMNPYKFSVKRSFPAFMRGLKKPFDFDARLKGGERAMILSGEYDKVFPMDIYPEFLLKAIMARDIDKMEKLGIYEVAPEDFALPEFVDTSKLPLQKIVREGLDYLRKELN